MTVRTGWGTQYEYPMKTKKMPKKSVTKKPAPMKAAAKKSARMAAKPSKVAKTKAPAKKAVKPAPKMVAKPTAVKASKPLVKPASKPVSKVVAKAPAGKVESKKVDQKISVKGSLPAKGVAVKGAKSESAVSPAVGKGKATVPVAAVLAKAEGKTKASKVALHHGDLMCREAGCENTATTKGFCRLDYIKNWRKIKRKEMILKEGKLNQYIEELVSKYPDKYMDVIRQDLSTEVTFTKVITDLELDESIDDLDYDNDAIDELIGGIRKDDTGFDDTEF